GGYNVLVLPNLERVCEAKRPDAAGNLGDLRSTVRTSIPCRRDQALDRPIFDTELISLARQSDVTHFWLSSARHQPPPPPPPPTLTHFFFFFSPLLKERKKIIEQE